MNLLGIDLPSWTVAIGTIITAFLVGFGAGIGSETGKYYFERHLKKVLEKISKKINLKTIHNNHKATILGRKRPPNRNPPS